MYAINIDDDWRKVGGEEPHADWEVHPKGPWNLALAFDPAEPKSSLEPQGPGPDAATGRARTGGVGDDPAEDGLVGADPFSDPSAAPKVAARGGIVESWHLDRGAAEDPPVSPLKRRPANERDVELVPYGVTNLRIAEIPWYVAGR